MSKLEITPAPWVWIKRGNYHDLVGGNGTIVISDGSASGEYKPDIDVKGLDASLIAAAPIMLAALEGYQAFKKHTRNCILCPQSDWGNCPEADNLLTTASNLCDVAITKARGTEAE